MRGALVALTLLFLVTGCQTPQHDEQQDTQAAMVAEPTLTPSSIAPSATASPPVEAAATATPEPTFTATPTPTAVPMNVIGDPRTVALRAPAANDGTICGLVDLFDFPLEPPHARNNARGGTDFGIFRSRYDKFHTGEDWWFSGGRSSLGAPVYSVGHGRVTYAEPTGWGRDQGVIIVRHNFADGRELLSFYGHLDPESFEVRAGDCVARGELIGKIGKPKTGPHLHFEMRTHMPLETGTGYWPVDPTLRGWVPPSATIWNSRMEASPGVSWTQPFAADGIQSVATVGDELFIILDGDELVGLDTGDGSEIWRMAAGEEVENALFNGEGQQIYTANQFGGVSAFLLPDEETNVESDGSQLLWEVDLDEVGVPELLPLPGGGVVLSSWGRYTALSSAGNVLWEVDMGARPFDWIITGDKLIVSANSDGGSLWSADTGGWQRWDSNIGGHLAASGDNVLLYDGSNLYRLSPETRSAEAILVLSGGSMQIGDVMALPDGGALISHSDPHDRRLIALDGNGGLLWERSIIDIPARRLELFAGRNQLLLVPQYSSNSGSEVSLFAIDLQDKRLTHLLTGGTRNNRVDQTRLAAIGDYQVLLNIDGRSLTAINTQEAVQMVSAVAGSSR